MSVRTRVRQDAWPPPPPRCHDCRGRLGPGQPGHEPGCAFAEHVRTELAEARGRLDRARTDA